MDSLDLCNAIRMEFGGILEDKIPLNAFPAKIQDMVLALARQENYSIEYMMASLLAAISTAIGNAVNIRIRGGWISNPALYMILVGRPGMGKTPPLDFAFRPIRKHDAKAVKQFKSDMEQYNNMVEDNKGKKENCTAALRSNVELFTGLCRERRSGWGRFGRKACASALAQGQAQNGKEWRASLAGLCSGRPASRRT